MHKIIARVTTKDEKPEIFNINYIPRIGETVIIKGIFYTVKDVIYTLDDAESIIITLEVRRDE